MDAVTPMIEDQLTSIHANSMLSLVQRERENASDGEIVITAVTTMMMMTTRTITALATMVMTPVRVQAKLMMVRIVAIAAILVIEVPVMTTRRKIPVHCKTLYVN